MKKFRISSRNAHNFHVVVCNFPYNYYVTVELDKEESGTWYCRVFSRDFLGAGRVEVMDLLHVERIWRSSRSSPANVAREALRHYLYDTFCNDDLSF